MNTIIDCLVERATVQGSRIALTGERGQMTFAQLCDWSLRASSWLAASGIRQGDHVALVCSNRPAFLMCWFGLANLGAVTVSVNNALVGQGLRYSIEQSESQAIVIEGELADARQTDLAPVLSGRKLFRFEDEADLFERLRAFDPAPVRDGKTSDPCTIIYTSGTTGAPKGVLNSHGAYIACGRHTVELMQLTAEDRIMVFLPLFHTNPQMYAVMSALVSGCSLAIIAKFSVSKFFDDARRFDCTAFTYVGTVLAMLTSRGPQQDRAHRLRGCVGGGAPLEVWQAVERRFGLRVHELYGMTEIGGWVSGNGTLRRRTGSCGPIRSDMEVRIFDPDDREVPAGERGEIVVRPRGSDLILSGYFRNAEASWRSSRNLWFHTGDAGSIDAEGFLYFHGRMTEIIRRGGESISPSDVESILLEHPLLRDAAVVGVPDPIFGQAVKAVVVRAQPVDAAAVCDFLKGRIAAFMLPRYVEFVDAIPRTETQKIQRNRLIERSGELFDLEADRAT